MDVELRHLRSFVAVAEEQHFRRAAKRLHIDHAPLSRQIRQLEKELGSELFDRATRPIRLTPAGAAFLTEARRLLGDVGQTMERGRRAGAGETGYVRVGAPAFAYTGVAGAVVRAFRSTWPNVGLELLISTIDDQLDRLLTGRLDVGLIGFTELLSFPGALAVEELASERMVAILPDQHKLAARPEVSLDDLAWEPFVVVGRRCEPELYDLQSAFFRGRGIVRDIVQEVPDPASMLGAIAAGVGVGVYPCSVSVLQRYWVTYRPIAGESPVATVFLAWRKDDDRERVGQFLDVARDVARRSLEKWGTNTNGASGLSEGPMYDDGRGTA